MGGRGAGYDSSKMSDGPTPSKGGGANQNWGQPNTPINIPSSSIRKQIGAKGKPISPDKAVKTINPDHTHDYGDYSENCQRCAMAFELNRRGYNVEASETYKNDPLPRGRLWAQGFKNPQFTKVGATTPTKVSKNLQKTMSEWGEGSRGIVVVSRGQGGHAFNVEYHKGKLHYYDAQTGSKYDPKRVFNHVTTSKVEVMRSDNLDIAQQITKMVRKKRK